MNEQEARDFLRLIETVKYLGGIAEKGEGRQQREDETTEQFVLGYVKRLEKENESLKASVYGLYELEKELYEIQAREAKLREALDTTLGCVDGYYIPALKDEFALADAPYDDTALKEYRKEVLLEAANAFEDGAFETPWGLRRMAEE